MDSLVLGSILALFIRLAATILLCVIALIQYRQFSFKSNLQPIKRYLMTLVGFLVLSNIPMGYLHVLRILGVEPTHLVTAISTVVNALAILLVAVYLLLVYKFRSNINE